MLKIKKNKQKAWVTFTVPAMKDVNDVFISGEWNEWKEEPMKQKKNGDFYITKVLKPSKSFEFGYKLNGNEWVTEEHCSSVSSPFSSQNSLLEL